MKIYAVLILIVSILLSLFLNIFTASAFFLDSLGARYSAKTGAVNMKIENLNIINNSTIIDNQDENIIIDAGEIRQNESSKVSFTLKNVGSNFPNYTLEIGLSDENDVGDFYLYSPLMSDSEIYEDIVNNNSGNAIINFENSNIIEDFGKLGILDQGLLNNSKDYSFKLFFLSNSTVNYSSEELSIEVAIFINANYYVWKTTKKYFLNYSLNDSRSYYIIENQHPKNYFISQAKDINLNDYATAIDNFGNNYDDKMIITSNPTFDNNKIGNYQINYSLYNAEPLDINLKIWGFTKIVSGNYHTLALNSLGQVYTWGYNNYGQLGDGTTAYNSIPSLVKGLENLEIIDVAAGEASSYALAKDGQLYSWGRNSNGRLGDNTTTTRNLPVSVVQPEGVKFIQVASRFGNVAAVTTDGDVYTWGYGGYYAIGTGSTNDAYKPTKIDLSNIIQVAMGYYNGAAISKDGKLFTWGDNLHGQVGNGTISTVRTPTALSFFSEQKVIDVSVGWYHTAAITENGNLYTWGYGAEGRLGNNSTVDRSSPQLITLPRNATKVETGYYHTGILLNDGSVYFCGQNAFGKNGSGNETNRLVPTLSPSIKNATYISLALDSSFVISNTEVIYGMGYGGTGVLGTGNNSNSNIPVSWKFTPPDPY